jgi:glycosyltransferase involved in cell wall biosynthesis
MKIIFDFRNTGMGNNGGTQTLVNSANTLVKLGHTIVCIDSGKNQYTWDELLCEHLVVKSDKDVPDADVIIATGFKSVQPTIDLPSRCGLKTHWIRAWETWQYSEEDIVKKVLSQPTIKLVNSICLKDKLLEYNITSPIIRPGYDFEKLYPMYIRGQTNELILGGLYREGMHGKRKRVDWLLNCGKTLRDRYSNVRFWLFGSEKRPKLDYVDNYVQGPTMPEKNKFYNQVDIWMAPTMSEGLHLPPAEAMLTECSVVSTTAKLSGTQDYTINGVTGIVTNDDIFSFVKGVETLALNAKLRGELGQMGRKKILQLGSREKNMNALISLLEGFINGFITDINS